MVVGVVLVGDLDGLVSVNDEKSLSGSENGMIKKSNLLAICCMVVG